MGNRSPRFAFVLPDAGGIVSGGFLYNRHLVDALRTFGATTGALEVEGLDLEELDIEEFGKRVRSGAPGRYFVDTRFLQAVGELPLERVDAHLIVHHLESLAPKDGESGDMVFERDEEPAIRRFDGFLVTSPFTEFYLVSRGVDPDRIVVVMPAAEGLAAGRREHSSTPTILLIGNLVTRKGVLPWLEAMAAELRADDDLTIRIVGGADDEPDYGRECRTFAAAHPMLRERVVFTGTVPHADVAAELAAADLFVSAASMETFGMGIQEAVAAGVPVFAVHAGYVASHVADGVHGRLFADVADLARGVRSTLDDRASLRLFAANAAMVRPQGESTWRDCARSFLAAYTDAP